MIQPLITLILGGKDGGDGNDGGGDGERDVFNKDYRKSWNRRQKLMMYLRKKCSYTRIEHRLAECLIGWPSIECSKRWTRRRRRRQRRWWKWGWIRVFDRFFLILNLIANAHKDQATKDIKSWSKAGIILYTHTHTHRLCACTHSLNTKFDFNSKMIRNYVQIYSFWS